MYDISLLRVLTWMDDRNIDLVSWTVKIDRVVEGGVPKENMNIKDLV